MLESLSGGIITVLAFIIVLGILVFVHELGHFATAKWAGIKVEEFGIGFPPRALTVMKRGETVYTLNWLPLGGFVRMVGENGEGGEDPRSFASKSALWRAIVLVAGSFMNLLLPIVLFALLSVTVGVPDGNYLNRIEVTGIEAGSPAQEAGIQSGDIILFVANQRMTRSESLRALVQNFDGRPITVDVERKGETIPLTITPKLDPTDQRIRLGVSIIDQRESVRYNPFKALAFGMEQTWRILNLMVEGLSQMVGGLLRGQGQAADVAGPLGIMQATGEVARTGRIENLVSFMAFLSINLAIMNMLPIPGLDGGRLLFVALEALRGGKRISPEREGMVHFLGIVLLLGLMALISILDIQRLAGGGSILQQ